MDIKQWRLYQYYVIIGIISLIALVFLPMLGSTVGLAWNLPNTTVGWVIYVTSKLLVATINILIFHCFVQQGKINIRNNPLYLEANEIMMLVARDKELNPKSPQELIGALYRGKGITIFVTTLAASIGLTQAILAFDLVTMLTYLTTIVMGIIFGIFTMNDSERIWTEEYWKYAQKVKKDNAEAAAAYAAKQEEEKAQAARAAALKAEQERLAALEEEKRIAAEKAEKAEKERMEALWQQFLAAQSAPAKTEEAAHEVLLPEPLP